MLLLTFLNLDFYRSKASDPGTRLLLWKTSACFFFLERGKFASWNCGNFQEQPSPDCWGPPLFFFLSKLKIVVQDALCIDRWPILMTFCHIVPYRSTLSDRCRPSMSFWVGKLFQASQVFCNCYIQGCRKPRGGTCVLHWHSPGGSHCHPN